MSNKRVILLLSILALILISAIPAVYFYLQYQQVQLRLFEAKALGDGDGSVLIERVGRHIELPDETPTIATISDTTQLAKQPFFTRAQNGDRVLVYKEARKVILYDPILDRIREVGPVEITIPTPVSNGTGNPQSQVSPAILRATTLMLLNGTSEENLTSQAEAALNAAGANTEVVGRAFAARRDYPTTLIIDRTGVRAKEAALAAQVFGATVGSLPPNEEGVVSPITPSPELVIILGADFVARNAQ